MLYAILGALIGVFVVSVIQIANALRVYLGAGERRSSNVTAEQRQPPAAVRQLLGELTVLGFRRLGETELVVPDLGTLGSLLGRRRRVTSWLTVDSAATTLAEVSAGSPLVSFETWLVDDSVVQTTAPAGEDIDEPDIRASAVKGGVAEAYGHHRLMVDSRAGLNGPPVGIHSMGDHMRHDALYRQRFARRYLRRALITQQLLPSGVMLVLTAVAAVWLLQAVLPQ